MLRDFFAENDLLCYVFSVTTVTIPQKEYQLLKKQSAAYRKLAGRFFDAIVKDSVPTVVEDFRKTGLYTEGFLGDLEDGLSKSSYARKS